MKIIKAKYEIMTPISERGTEELKKIEQIGRVCYKSEWKIIEKYESHKKFVQMIINCGHESVLEHMQLTIRFIVDRGISHQIIRHRLASYSQETTNINYQLKDDECTFIDINEGIKLDHVTKLLDAETIDKIINEWISAMEDAERHYMNMLNLGASTRIARSVLPNSMKTELIMTANYREWRHFFKLRIAKDAHPQMREITIPLLAELKCRLPIIFDDIY